MFYQSRFYDPALSRFASADTIIPDGAQGLDRYAYTGNNPIRYTDPSGHCAMDADADDCFVPGRQYKWQNPSGKAPFFSKSPVSKDDLEWTQWFGGTEFAKNGGSAWGYDKYCQGYHCGIDFGADWGDSVFAGTDGVVYEIGETDGGGYHIVIKNGDYYILYQALDGNTSLVVGDIVTPDTIIAGVGNHAADQTGGNTHLHLELMHYSQYAIDHNSTGAGWRADLIENPLLYMDESIIAQLEAVVPYSPSGNITFANTTDQNPLNQPSPMHRGGTNLWK